MGLFHICMVFFKYAKNSVVIQYYNNNLILICISLVNYPHVLTTINKCTLRAVNIAVRKIVRNSAFFIVFILKHII